MIILKTREYESWFRRVRDSVAKAKINARMRRIELSGEIVGDCKPVGDKVVELRFDTGPGYRVYVTGEGNRLIILLIGGDKSSQNEDIAKAKHMARVWRSENEHRDE